MIEAAPCSRRRSLEAVGALLASFLFIPMRFVLPYLNRWFSRLTGRVYPWPVVMCLVFVMMMPTSNACYIPLP